MVDFQSRETQRGPLTDDEPDDEPSDDGRSAEQTDETRTQESAEADVERGVAVITVDVDASAESDGSASDAVVSAIERVGWTVVERETIDASYDAVQSALDRLLNRRGVAAIVTVGGVGVGPADVTVEAADPLLEKRLPGFGELFRVQYFDRAGPTVVGMRPVAGVADGVPVFCLPGDTEPARFAVDTILAETLDSLVEAASGSGSA
ncbi:MAG: molybdenum cofactor biosynthesis protein B [Halorhabdus sp.]